jgi:ribulose-5-phosphate 4-epimerase/fuculose-1-phosphate aldolase
MREEGVIKFALEFTAAGPVAIPGLGELNAWRRILWQLGLIGQDADRYGGYSFGNVSRRVEPYDAPANRRPFVISGSQTGHLADLSSTGFATVSEYDPSLNRLVAAGPIKPSSESMTHGAVYNANSEIHVILHVHSPTIWQYAAALGLPITAGHVRYGTPGMPREVERLFRETNLIETGIFAMGGHEDGVIAFGRTADEAGGLLIRVLARSYTVFTGKGSEVRLFEPVSPGMTKR